MQTLGEDCTWVCIKQSASQRFAQSAKEGKGKKVASLLEEFSEFSSIFSKKESERLPDHCPWDCKIEEKPDFQRKVAQAYPIPPALMETFNKWLQENLRKGYIRPSESDQASGFFFISKKESGEY